MLHSIASHHHSCCAAATTTAAMLLQSLHKFQSDAIMAVGLPAAIMIDNMGCLLSHALGVPFIDMNGMPLLSAPPGIPQVWDVRLWLWLHVVSHTSTMASLSYAILSDCGTRLHTMFGYSALPC